MTKLEVLELLKNLIADASIWHTDPEDYSGVYTDYYVDHEQLMKNTESKIDEEHISFLPENTNRELD